MQHIGLVILTILSSLILGEAIVHFRMKTNQENELGFAKEPRFRTILSRLFCFLCCTWVLLILLMFFDSLN